MEGEAREAAAEGGRMRGRQAKEGQHDAVTAKERRKHHEQASYEEPDEQDIEQITAEEQKRAEGDGEGEGEEEEEEVDEEEGEEAQRLRLEGKYNDEGGNEGGGSDDSSDEEREEANAESFSSLRLSALLHRHPYLRSITFDPKQTWRRWWWLCRCRYRSC